MDTTASAQTAPSPDSVPLRTREIAPGIHRLSTCSGIPGSEGKLHLGGAAYLIQGGDASLLVDVGSPGFERRIEVVLEDMLGPRGLDWIFPTHLEYAHAGGLEWMAARYPNARIIADAHDYQLYFPQLVPRLTHASVGSRLDLGGGYRLVFVKALLRDLTTTLWAYEESQRVLFVADGFAFLHHPEAVASGEPLHLPEECTRFFSEIAQPPTPTETGYLNRAAFWWTHHRQAEPFIAAIHEQLRRYPTRLIAPAHGLVIDDAEAFIPIMHEGSDMAYAIGGDRKV